MLWKKNIYKYVNYCEQWKRGTPLPFVFLLLLTEEISFYFVFLIPHIKGGPATNTSFFCNDFLNSPFTSFSRYLLALLYLSCSKQWIIFLHSANMVHNLQNPLWSRINYSEKNMYTKLFKYMLGIFTESEALLKMPK